MQTIIDHPIWSAIVLLAVFLLLRALIQRITVFEFERGVRYSKGRFRDVLSPGQYWFIPFWTRIDTVDVRSSSLTVPGQEVLTADGVSLKVSIAARVEVTDPAVALNDAQSYLDALYLELQLALRDLIGSSPIDEVLEDRASFGPKLQERVAARAQELGVTLHEANLKDVMFPGALKQTFARVVEARMQGQASLERARGETAALRSLANAAKVMEHNPTLMQLRSLQSLEGTTGGTLVLGVPGGFPLPKTVANGNGVQDDKGTSSDEGDAPHS